jgi:hypothetical protein
MGDGGHRWGRGALGYGQSPHRPLAVTGAGWRSATSTATPICWRLRGEGRNAQRTKRPTTDAELAALLGGDCPAGFSDLVRVLALSGMRVSEGIGLTVDDMAGGFGGLRRQDTGGYKPRAGASCCSTHYRAPHQGQDCWRPRMNRHRGSGGASSPKPGMPASRRGRRGVGQAQTGITDGVYNVDFTDALLKRCVEAVGAAGGVASSARAWRGLSPQPTRLYGA